jgi:Fe-S cluster assembly protein SufD
MSAATLELPSPTATSEEGPAWPLWFEDERLKARADYAASQAPTRRDEAWRFSDLKAIAIDQFVPAGAVADPSSIISRSSGVSEFSARIVLGNNRLLHMEAANLPEGVVLVPLETAAREHADLFREFFMTQPVELGSHRFAALHRAEIGTGAFLFVPEGIEIARPIEIFHWVEGANASIYPHTLVVCGARSKVTVIDHFRSCDDQPAFACGVNDLHVAEGASLTYVAAQDWSQETLAFHINSTIVAKDAASTALTANFGGRFVRAESLSRMVGEGARSEMFSLNPLEGNRQIDQRTLQDHAAPNAASDLLYLNALDDKARSIFAGLIKVQTGAHRTDAYQKVRNLMLSDEAEANSMPGLEILADDVRCTHGATSGEINADELFYLEARGIPEKAGRRLIVDGFFNTLLERVQDPIARGYLARSVAARLGIPAPVEA